jgi:hypothetical protein
LPREIDQLTIVSRRAERPRAPPKLANRRKNVNRPRSADDFAAIRARMEELRRERERAQAPEGDLPCDRPVPRTRTDRWPPSEISGGPGLVRQSGAVRS